MRGISKYLSLCLLIYHKSLISQLVKEFELISNNRKIRRDWEFRNRNDRGAIHEIK